ncbi:unnamed protein product [Lactuca virosa]|uniref:Uncharacterized protein n=1 Tax=Lactuca virosa TaxID=75947 RepID=A0AAU9M475_9ASTR|nr:unnamed protein product [Lactuca virosa]
MKAISFSNLVFIGSCCHHHCPHTNNLRHRAESFVVGVGKGTNGRRNLVDENMIVLRMRIREVEMEETSGLSPEKFRNWMVWEKKYYEHYNQHVCEAMMVLQMCLMNTRPCFALGALALLMLSVILSTGVVINNFFSFVRWFM